MQIPLLISNMSVDSSLLDQNDLILPKMLTGWYCCARSHLSRKENQLPGTIGFRSDLDDKSAGADLALGLPETRVAFIFFQQQWVAPACAGAIGFCCADTVTTGSCSNAERTDLFRTPTL
jgi:hypothetical protein